MKIKSIALTLFAALSIAFSANAAAKIESSAPGALDHFKEAGFRFDAGQEA